AWPENADNPDLPQLSEALLRLLGEPRGRDSYLAAVTRWAEKMQAGLEDEQAEESRRRRTHELAQQCLPFLRRFFAAWDGMPASAALDEPIAWLRRSADDLGLSRAAEAAARAAPLFARLWEELDGWLERERFRGEGRHLERKVFQRRLQALANTAGLPR